MADLITTAAARERGEALGARILAEIGEDLGLEDLGPLVRDLAAATSEASDLPTDLREAYLVAGLRVVLEGTRWPWGLDWALDRVLPAVVPPILRALGAL